MNAPKPTAAEQTAEQRVKEVWPDVFAVNDSDGDIWYILRTSTGEKIYGRGRINLLAWNDAASRLPPAPIAAKMNPDTTCSHCGRDMNKRPWETCSNGGICMSISEFNECRLEKMMKDLSKPHNGFISPEEVSSVAPIAAGTGTEEQRVRDVYPDAKIGRDHYSAYFLFTKKGAGGRISEYVGSEELAWKSAASKLPSGIEPTPAQPKSEMHPVQVRSGYGHKQAKVTSLITARAYEVYCEVYSPQPALMDLDGRNCRGGFGVGELIAFLYARSFPKNEWRAKVNEAFEGMENING